MDKKRIDWDKIKSDYISGDKQNGIRAYPTFRELGQKYTIAFTTICTRAKREDWSSERQIVSNKIVQRRSEKTIEQISDKGVKFDLESFRIAEATQQKLKILLNKEDIKISEGCILIKALKDNQSFAKEALGETSTEKETIIISPDFVPENDKHNE